MKYLIKSNLIIFIAFFVPGLIMLGLLDDSIFSANSTYVLGLTLVEGFIFKINYDYLNYEHDFKYFVHRLPKKVFLILPIILNIIAIILILLLSTNFKYLLFLSLIFCNCFHILFKKSTYFLPLLVLAIWPNFLMVYRGMQFYIWWGAYAISSIGIAYFITHKKTTVYTNDNY